MKIGRYILLTLLLLPLLVSCGGRDADRIELERIDSLASNRQPRRALELLDSIDSQSLSESNRNLYELMRIKARDKDFQVHRSNATILRLVEYYKNHPSEGRYPEALYYAGRVHFDLGDYPSALKYFYQCLDQLDDSKENIWLKSVATGQIADLLNKMRLYDQAIYYFKFCDKLFRLLNDSIAIAYNDEAIGNAYLHKKDFKNAEKYYNNAYAIAKTHNLHPTLASIQMHMAAIELGRDNISKALNLIRDVPDKINETDYDVAIGYAADIYLQAGIKDTAYYYADKLKDIKGNSQKLGFQLLLKHLTDLIEPDSIVPYVKKYTDVMEGFVRKNADEAALLQHTVYNYSVLEKERDKANQKNKTLQWIIFGLALTSVAFFILALFLYFSNKKRKALSLALSKENNNLNQALYKNKSVNIKNSDSTTLNYNSPVENRDRLRQLIKDSINKFEPMPDIQKIITDSALYKELLAMSKNNVAVPDKSPKWQELEKLVLSAYPDFLDRINILSLGKYKTTEYHYVLLTKCGFGPKATSVLMHIIPSGITYRKNKVLKILFDNIIDAKDFNTAIALL